MQLCRDGVGGESASSKGNAARGALGELGGLGVLVSVLGSSVTAVQLAALDGLKEASYVGL